MFIVLDTTWAFYVGVTTNRDIVDRKTKSLEYDIMVNFKVQLRTKKIVSEKKSKHNINTKKRIK